MELQFADPEKDGKGFNCFKCDEETRRRRRCRESREDFTGEDANLFPIQIFKQGGELYGFCPAKATWDQSVVGLFQTVIMVAETKALPKSGGLDDQDGWLMDILPWFLPKYDMMKFSRKASMIMGEGKPKDGPKSDSWLSKARRRLGGSQ